MPRKGEKKKGRGNMPGKEKKKIKNKNWQRQCASAYKHFRPLSSLILSLQFSLHFREKNFLVGSKRKHLDPTIYFPSSSPNQTHSQKDFLPIFSTKFSIHLISPPNKHILRVRFWHPWFELQTQVGTEFTLSHYFQPKT